MFESVVGTMLAFFVIFALFEIPTGHGVPILSNSQGNYIFDSVLTFMIFIENFLVRSC